MMHGAQRKAGTKGQSLLEFALIVPLLFILVMNVVNFAGMLFAWICVENAARAGVQYLVMAGATAGSMSQPAPATVAALVRADLDSLPNHATAQVGACTRNNGTVACSGTGSPPADPEGAAYASASVDVTYTYRPLAGTWTLIGMSPTLFANAAADGSISIHRQATMRILQ
jgi:Flp pilus assembly protein TadG